MNLVYTLKDGTPLYKLRKTNPGYELMKWNQGGELITMGRGKGNISKAGWKSMGKYPHHIAHASSIILEDLMTNTSGDFDKRQLKEFLNAFTDSINVLREKAEELPLSQ